MIIVVLLVHGAMAIHSHVRAEENPSRRQRFELLKAEFDTKFAAFRKAAETIASDAEAAEVRKLRPSAKDYGRRFMALARERAADEVACDALVWVLEHDDQRDGHEQLEEAVSLIARHHIATPKLKQVIPNLA
jgi:hypothetical protein